MHGSYHWDFERFLAVSLVPLTAATVINGTGSPTIDLLFGIVLPLHCHLGFDQAITDYLPERKGKYIHKGASWSLRLGTVLVLVACYNFNTTDIGLTELVKRTWKA